MMQNATKLCSTAGPRGGSDGASAGASAGASVGASAGASVRAHNLPPLTQFVSALTQLSRKTGQRQYQHNCKALECPVPL